MYLKKRLAAAIAAMAAAQCAIAADSGVFAATSPDGRSAIRLHTKPELGFSVEVDGKERIAFTPVGMDIEGRPAIGGADCKPGKPVYDVYKGKLVTPLYKKASVNLTANETLVPFEGGWRVRLVARDDGVAYRFETLFKKESGDTVAVKGETAGFRLAATCKSVLSTAPSPRSVYNGDPFQHPSEGLVEATAPDAVFGDGRTHVFGPVVAEFEDGVAIAAMESDIIEYPSMEYVKDDSAPRAFRAAFQPLPEKYRCSGWTLRAASYTNCIARTHASRKYPWRVFGVAPEIGKLPGNDAVFALASPAQVDSKWVKPGKCAWEWWNSRNISGVQFKAGVNNETYEHYIDFAAEFKLEYAVLDLGWSKDCDPMKPLVDVPRLVKYGAKRGVGLIIWIPRACLTGEKLRSTFKHYAKMGVKGVKIDGLDGRDQSVSAFMVRAARAAAECKLFLDFHGVYCPAGLNRTFPNVLNFEGVYGMENVRWASYPESVNNIRTAYTRLAAGPADYTPGAFRNRTAGDFKPSSNAPCTTTTRAHQMALFVHFSAPLMMPCDSPSVYRREKECFDFVSKIPVTWDETVGVGGTGDSHSAIARRKGDVWYLSVIGGPGGGKSKTTVPFLDKGKWTAEIFADGMNAARDPADYEHLTDVTLEYDDTITMQLAPNGGYVARIVRKKEQ